jgi:hypothetical protein
MAAAGTLRDVDTRGKVTKTQGSLRVTLLGLELTKQWRELFDKNTARSGHEIVVIRFRLKNRCQASRC